VCVLQKKVIARRGKLVLTYNGKDSHPTLNRKRNHATGLDRKEGENNQGKKEGDKKKTPH